MADGQLIPINSEINKKENQTEGGALREAIPWCFKETNA
jgi:hypothetical protein